MRCSYLLDGPTTVAANASDGIVIVCTFKMSAYPPAPVLWPPGRAAAGPIIMERSTYRCSADVHGRVGLEWEDTNLDQKFPTKEALIHFLWVNSFILPQESWEIVSGDTNLE